MYAAGKKENTDNSKGKKVMNFHRGQSTTFALILDWDVVTSSYQCGYGKGVGRIDMASFSYYYYNKEGLYFENNNGGCLTVPRRRDDYF